MDDYIDDAEWAQGKVKDDFRLLCPGADGNQCLPVDQFDQCNIARVPAHAAGVNPAYSNPEIMVHIREAFALAVEVPEFQAMFFGDNSNDANLIFKSGTTNIIPVTEGTVAFMAGAYDAYEALAEIEDEPCSPADPEGDLTLSGSTDVTDVVCSVDYIVGDIPYADECELGRSDLNSDGFTNILDILGIVQIILATG